MNAASRAAAAILCAVLAAGCDRLGGSKTPFKSVDVTGAPMGGELRLTDQNGKPRSLADFRGKLVLVNFGYTINDKPLPRRLLISIVLYYLIVYSVDPV